MRSLKITGAAALVVVSLAGCDILELDTFDPPGSTLTGRVVYQGQPLGVRSGGVTLELWQPDPVKYELNQKITVQVDQDGSYNALLFNGSYEINLLAGNGPWVTNTTRIPVEVNGNTVLDVPAVPYYMIQNEQITFNPAAGTTGAIQATFNVGQITTTQNLEYVGVYIGVTTFVDRNTGLAIPNAQRERSRAAILQQLNANQPITISVNLPANIYLTEGPWRREYVFVRVGVKTVGVGEMLFTPVYKVSI